MPYQASGSQINRTMSSQASAFVEEVKAALFKASNDANKVVIEAGIKNCDRKLRILNAAIKAELNVGIKQHLQGAITLIKGFRNTLKKLQIVGFGYQPTKETVKHRVKWEDLYSAFASRMRTGAVINLKHKDVKNFLQDAMILFRRRAHNLFKKVQAVKINTAFCGEFVISKGDNREIREYKYITTKNIPLYRDTKIED